MTNHRLLHKLTGKLGGSISDVDGDRIMQFYNSYGYGRAMSFVLEHGLSFEDYDFEMAEDFSLSIPSEKPTIYFIYCIEGGLEYYWQDNPNEVGNIQELQTVILGSQNDTLTLKFPKGKKTGVTIIRATEEEALPTSGSSLFSLNAELFAHFMASNEIDKFHYHGTLNLRIREQLLTIRLLQHRGIVRKLMINGIVNFTLGLEILHHENDVSQRTVLASSLTNRELNTIKQAVDDIATKPEFNYSIEYLCETYMISARKLQEGFKVLTGKTVAAYISDERLNLAEKLIKKGNMNISEVVYSIGFSSRSYFSKIFREKYNCTPRYYLKENSISSS